MPTIDKTLIAEAERNLKAHQQGLADVAAMQDLLEEIKKIAPKIEKLIGKFKKGVPDKKELADELSELGKELEEIEQKIKKLPGFGFLPEWVKKVVDFITMLGNLLRLIEDLLKKL